MDYDRRGGSPPGIFQVGVRRLPEAGVPRMIVEEPLHNPSMKRLLLLLCAACCLAACGKAPAEAVPDLIPRPASLQPGSGCFRLPATLELACADSTWLPAAEFLRRSLPDGVTVEAACGAKAPFTVVRSEGLDTIGG